MHKKLHISLIFCNSVVPKSLSTHTIVMHNFVTKFGKILKICKRFTGYRVNEKGNIPRRGVVPKFSDVEAIVLSFTAKAFAVDSENYLFNRQEKECSDAVRTLSADTRWEYHDCMIMGDKGYLSTPIQLDLSETANITLDMPYRLNQEDMPPYGFIKGSERGLRRFSPN